MRTLLKLFYLLPVVVVLGLVGFLVLNRSKPPPVRVMTGRPFATAPITNLTANLFTSENQLGPAGNDVFIEFRDAAGKLVDVGDVQFELSLSVPSAIITHITCKVLRTSTPGQYRVTVHPQIAGDWQAKLTITGPSVPAEATFPVSVK
jgi:xanthosine utilization system XapX-like protein